MNDHAVVLGGSMAGLVAARVLSAHFRHVTVVEKDYYEARPAPRRGLPQSRHVHFVLDKGRCELERLFPSFAADLEREGALCFDYGRDARILTAQGWLPPFESQLRVRACTRPLIDWLVHQYVAELPQVEIRSGSEVKALLSDGTNRSIRGVLLQTPSGETTLEADLVVDATGRLSRAPDWLCSLGYSRVEEIFVDSHLTYCCRIYTPPADVSFSWKMLSILPQAPDYPQSGVIFPIETGQWVACIATMGEGIRLPGDDAGFLAFAARLPNPQFHAALSLATPASPIFKRGRSPGQLRRFDRMSRFPERFVVLGDAACALNPIYGQGITVATLACTLLGRELERSPAHRPGFSHRFQRKLARQNADAWMLAIGSDLAWPTTHSNLPEWQQSAFRLAQPVMQRAGRAVTAAATADSLIASAVMERMHMCRSANSLMRGFVLRGVLGSFLHPPASLQPE